MDFLFEFLFQFYLEIGEILIPDRKFKKWQETLLKVAGILVSLVILGCIVAGVCVLLETSSRISGIVLLSVGCALLAIQIALFVIALVHQIKKEKRRKAQSPDEPPADGN